MGRKSSSWQTEAGGIFLLVKRCAGCQELSPLGDFRELRGRNGKTRHYAYCPPCAKAYQDKYRKDNRDHLLKEKKRHYEENAEQYKSRARKWAEENKDRKRAVDRAWRDANRERKAAIDRAWRKANPEKRRSAENKRRALKRGLEANLTGNQWRAILASWDGRCANPECRTRENICQDHIISFKMGGHHAASNVQPLCTSCNSSKGARSFSYLRPIFKPKNGPQS